MSGIASETPPRSAISGEAARYLSLDRDWIFSEFSLEFASVFIGDPKRGAMIMIEPVRCGALAAALVLCLSFLAGCGQSDPSSEASLAPARLVPTPKRTPGLWREKLTMGGGHADATLCLDAATDQKLAWWGQAGSVGKCQKHDVSQNPDGSWSFDALCKGADGTSVAVSGSATGDFNSGYQISATSDVQGSPDPNLAGRRRFEIDAVHLGACPSGMPPGAMDLPGVGRIDALTGHLIH